VNILIQRGKIRKNSSPGTGSNKIMLSRAFTLLELLIALMISSIILTAVVTLSYAMNSAYESTSEMNQKEAYIRHATVKISDLIKHSRLICKASSNEIAIWKEDTNGDNLINISELVYLETGKGNYLRLLEFNPSDTDDELSLYFIKNYYYAKLYCIYKYPETYTTFISDCTNAKIEFDQNPPNTQKVIISFDIEENKENRKCQIISNLRCPMNNFIDTDGKLISDDDDL